jgi:hypothetical protein
MSNISGFYLWVGRDGPPDPRKKRLREAGEADTSARHAIDFRFLRRPGAYACDAGQFVHALVQINETI